MSLKYSLSTLLSKLIAGSPSAPAEEFDDGKKLGTTIRFDTRTRLYIEQQAEYLGLSTQEFVSMTFRALMLASEDKTGIRGEMERMADRVLDVFYKHRIAASDIADLLDNKIMNSDLLSTNNLVNKIDNDMIEKISDLFCVSCEWIKGSSKYPIDGPVATLYKNLYGVAERLIRLVSSCHRVTIIFVGQEGLTIEKLAQAQQKSDSSTRVEMGVAIHKSNFLNGVSFDTYEVWDAERWNYWRCRYHLKGLMLFAERAGINYKGVLLPKQQYEAIFNGECFPIEYLSNYRNIWYPDQLFWNDERNLERSEIYDIKKFYDEQKVAPLEKAAKSRYLIANLKEFLAGKPIHLREE